MENKYPDKHTSAAVEKTETMSHKKLDSSALIGSVPYNHSISEKARKKLEDFTNEALHESQQLIEIICKKVNGLLQESKKRLDLIRYLSSSSNPSSLIEQQLGELSDISLNLDIKEQIRVDLVNHFSITKSESPSSLLNSLKKVNEQLEEGNIILHNIQNANENSILERIKLLELELFEHREKFEKLNIQNKTEPIVWVNIKDKVTKKINKSSDRLFEVFNEAQKANKAKFEAFEKDFADIRLHISDQMIDINAKVKAETLREVENTYRALFNQLGSQAKQSNYFIQMFSNSFEDEDNLVKKITFTKDKKFIFIGKVYSDGKL